MTPPRAKSPEPVGTESFGLINLPRRTLGLRRWTAKPGAAPAVMVHGLGGLSGNWSYFAPLLADRLDSVALDLPGFGQSPPPRDGDYTPDGHANAVIDVIESTFPGQPVHLFGNSLGGHVSSIVAVRRPDLVRTLTLVSPALPSLQPAQASISVPLTATPFIGSRIIAKYDKLPPVERARNMANLVLADISNAPDGWLDSVTSEFRARVSLTYAQDAYLQSARGLIKAYLKRGGQDLWRDIERIEVPTLLVFGQLDKLVPVSVGYKARAAFKNSRLLLLPLSGHVAMIEHPQLVERSWRRFIDEAVTLAS